MRLRSTSRKLARLKYPQIIRSIEKILKDHIGNTSFNLANTDGRINSIYDENMIIQILEKHYGDAYVRRPTQTRHWYDVKIKSQYKWIPFNIKVSTGGTDNALCKKAFVYSLSTLTEEEIPHAMSFNKMIELVEENKNTEREIEKEYYYIYIDKKDGTIMIKSMCDIQYYVANAQNWLQINWSKEKQHNMIDHYIESVDEAYARIRKVMGDSLRKLLETSDKLL
jgi:hypothetical protein